MNPIQILAIFASVLISLEGQAQVNAELHRFSDMTVTEAEQYLRQPLNGEQASKFVHALFEARRLDLIKVAWLGSSSGGSSGWVVDEVAGLPESPFKEDVLLLMLKTDSFRWPDVVPYGSRGILENTEPYTALIRKYLPNVEPTLRLIDTRDARLKLVARIEEARRTKEESRPEQRDQIINTPPRESASQIPSVNDKAGNAPNAPDASPRGARPQSSLWLWVCVIASCIAVVTILIKRWQKREPEHRA
jgi:hypothetical protein